MSDLQLETKVKELAKSKGVTMKNLCQRIEMTEAGMNFSLKNHTLKITTLEKIASVLDVEIAYFFNDGRNNDFKPIGLTQADWYDLVGFLKILDYIMKDDKAFEKSNPLYKKRREEIMGRYEKMMNRINNGKPNKPESGLEIESIRDKISDLLLIWDTTYDFIKMDRGFEIV